MNNSLPFYFCGTTASPLTAQRHNRAEPQLVFVASRCEHGGAPPPHSPLYLQACVCWPLVGRSLGVRVACHRRHIRGGVSRLLLLRWQKLTAVAQEHDYPPPLFPCCHHVGPLLLARSPSLFFSAYFSFIFVCLSPSLSFFFFVCSSLLPRSQNFQYVCFFPFLFLSTPIFLSLFIHLSPSALILSLSPLFLSLLRLSVSLPMVFLFVSLFHSACQS